MDSGTADRTLIGAKHGRLRAFFQATTSGVAKRGDRRNQRTQPAISHRVVPILCGNYDKLGGSNSVGTIPHARCYHGGTSVTRRRILVSTAKNIWVYIRPFSPLYSPSVRSLPPLGLSDQLHHTR